MAGGKGFRERHTRPGRFGAVSVRVEARGLTAMRTIGYAVSFPMSNGMNTDVEHRGRFYHVQTEDKGLTNPVVESLAYLEGEIVAARRFTYTELTESGEFSANDLMRSMEAQHQGLIRDLRAGKFDEGVPMPLGHDIVSNRSFDEVVAEFLAEHPELLGQGAEAEDPKPAESAGPILTPERLTRLGGGGLGQRAGRRVESALVFDDRLYVAISHDGVQGTGDTASILGWDRGRGVWNVLHRSSVEPVGVSEPARETTERGRAWHQSADEQIPRDRGCRGLALLRSAADPMPVLYAATLSSWGARILRSADGESFTAVSKPGILDGAVRGAHALVPFRGRLFLAGAAFADAGVWSGPAGRAAVYVSDDPRGGTWHEAVSHLGDRGNRAVLSLAVFQDHLYAGTANPRLGFELWRTAARGAPPFVWEPVITEGAGRFTLNEAAVAMAAFGDALYVGTGLPGMGRDEEHDIGPAAAELIRVHPDDSWDLVAGTPRFSPDGLKVPLSILGPGFDDAANGRFEALAVHAGCLYVGTHHWRSLDAEGSHAEGGFQLWATKNGEDWTCVVRDGQGDALAVGLSCLASSPMGLLVGSASHRREMERSAAVPASGADRGCSVWLAR
jgi:hypothetical protein